MLGRILDVLFPPACVACGGGSWPFCSRCRGALATLTPPGCRRCGRPFGASVDGCADCPPASISWARSAFLYEGPARRALVRLKFSGLRSTTAALAPWMVWALARSPPPAPFLRSSPVITWVPLGPRRLRSRGFDQAEALARAVGALTGWPVARLLDRTVETDPQAKRSGLDRRRALRGAFRARAAAPRPVILVDDVLTTGATAGACASELRASGATGVGLLCAARSLGGPVPSHCYNPPVSQPGSVVARERFSW